jgi:hypothetical protein
VPALLRTPAMHPRISETSQLVSSYARAPLPTAKACAAALGLPRALPHIQCPRKS